MTAKVQAERQPDRRACMKILPVLFGLFWDIDSNTAQTKGETARLLDNSAFKLLNMACGRLHWTNLIGMDPANWADRLGYDEIERNR